MYYTVIFQHIDLFHFVQKQTVSAVTYFTQKHTTQNISSLARGELAFYLLSFFLRHKRATENDLAGVRECESEESKK